MPKERLPKEKAQGSHLSQVHSEDSADLLQGSHLLLLLSLRSPAALWALGAAVGALCAAVGTWHVVITCIPAAITCVPAAITCVPVAE